MTTKEELEKRLAELEAELAERKQVEAQVEERAREVVMFKALVENSRDAILAADSEGWLTYINQASCDLYGYESQEMIGLSSASLGLEEDIPFFLETIMPQVMAGGWSGEVRQRRKDGAIFYASDTVFPLYDTKGQIIGTAAVVRDITAQKQAETERERLQQEIIKAQQRAIAELSTPVIPIMDRIIVMPLIGSIDSLRARDITRNLLVGIQQHRAKIVILDVTGVGIMDTGIVNHLNKTIQAARLKGAQTIVTGVSDAVAEAIVDLGIDWSGIETLSDLQTGLVVALDSLRLRLEKF
jgi:rsbT co-antagonist protein RsbR